LSELGHFPPSFFERDSNPGLKFELTYLAHTDYLTLKLWDVRSEARPLRTIPVHDHLKGRLCDLYENDCIFDKWECVWGAGGRCVCLSPSTPTHPSHPLSDLHCAMEPIVFFFGTEWCYSQRES
jgi:hypothetical protein